LTEFAILLERLEAHLSIEQIAEFLGCSPRYVSLLKAGGAHDPRAQIADGIRYLHGKHCRILHGERV